MYNEERDPALPQPAKRARQFAGWGYGCYAWLVFSLVILCCGGAVALLRTPSRGRPLARAAARLLFRLGGMRLSVDGLDRLPGRPHILLVNHTSFLDGIVLSALLPARPGYAFTVRQQHPSQAVLWPLLKGLGTIVLKHAAPPQRSMNIGRLAAALGRGENLIIFPEGRFTPESGLQPFHSGAFVAAAAAHVPVVVAGLRGTRQALRLGTWMPRRTAIHLEIGPALMPGGKDEDAVLDLNRAAWAAMLPLTGEGPGRERAAPAA